MQKNSHLTKELAKELFDPLRVNAQSNDSLKVEILNFNKSFFLSSKSKTLELASFMRLYETTMCLR